MSERMNERRRRGGGSDLTTATATGRASKGAGPFGTMIDPLRVRAAPTRRDRRRLDHIPPASIPSYLGPERRVVLRLPPYLRRRL